MTGIIFIDTHSLWSIPSLFLIRINLLSSRICIRKFSRVKLNLNKTIIGEELVKRTTKLHYLRNQKFLSQPLSNRWYLNQDSTNKNSKLTNNSSSQLVPLLKPSLINPITPSISNYLPTVNHLVFIYSDVLAKSWQIAAGLSKSRLTALVVSTALVGCALAAPTSLVSSEFLSHPIKMSFCLALGTTLTSAAANTINQIIEIPNDSQMSRTRNRVLVRGLISPSRAGMFAIGTSVSGISLLYFCVNSLVSQLAFANLLLYCAVYTPSKQINQMNTWIGAFVGAIPPLMGWAAATGQLHCGSLFLASLLYAWQFPHFMALSWNARSDYSKAGYSMSSVVDPALCKRVALRHAVNASLVCLAGCGCSAASLGPWAGSALGLACLPTNASLIYFAWKFFKAPPGAGSAATARNLFRATLYHLPVVMSVMLLGTYLCCL